MSFSKILGQGPAIRNLKRIVETEKIASSYLFTGPPGVGKKKAAIAFVRVLNCEKKEKDACGICPSCRAIDKGTYGDLILLEPQGPVQRHHIDTIRTMQSFVNLRSLYGGWKAVIIDEADRMTEEAAASLLKIMEEPPLKTFFILVSSRPENIFETIISRCQVIRFLPLAKEIQRAISVSTPEREAWRKEILNWNASTDDIFSISQKITKGEEGGNKQDFIMNTLHLLFTWWRDVLFIKEGLGEILNKDYEKEIMNQANRLSLAALWRNLRAIIHAQRDIMRQVNSRLVLDTLFLTLGKEGLPRHATPSPWAGRQGSQ